MIYDKVIKGVFINRPNRFIAHVKLENGEIVLCHVKNTGRCQELLVPGYVVFLQENDSLKRKTKYTLISVIKENRLFNLDSTAPNELFYEFVKSNNLYGEDAFLKREFTFSKSRFDLYIENEMGKYLIEIKGVTLEIDNVALFPDAKTLRGTKHINELIHAKEQGYNTSIIFILAFEGAKEFRPNSLKDNQFSNALALAYENNVEILAFSCKVSENSIEIFKKVPVII
jgi:sugar fermentation stimulation protein A